MTARTRLLAVAFAVAATLSPSFSNAGSALEEPPLPTILEPTEEERTKILAAVATAEETKDDQLLGNCLLEMERLKHADFVPAIELGLKSKDAVVLRVAILAASTHDVKAAGAVVKKLMKGGGKDDQATSAALFATCVDYLARTDTKGFEKAVLETLDKTLQSEIKMKSPSSGDLARASIHYLGKRKFKSSVELFVSMLKEPVPADPNAATNPPATYWEARYGIWLASEGWVRWALKEITGEEWRSVREWDVWWDRNKKKFQ